MGITDSDAYARAATLMAELLSQRTDPLAGIFARGGTGIQWSRVVVVPPFSGLVLPDPEVTDMTPVLSVNVAEGFPRIWTVTVREVLDGAQRRSYGLNSFCRIRWANGNLASFADFDMTAVAACFPVTAQSLTVEAFNANAPASVDPPPVGGPISLACAVSGAFGAQEYRAPRRTIRVEIPINIAFPGVRIIIPSHAQQVAFHYAPSQPIPLTGEWRDAKDKTISEMFIPGNLTSPVVQDIPGAASSILILTNPNAALLKLAAVFRLGF